MRILLLFSGRFGQTRKIAGVLAAQWADIGIETELADLHGSAVPGPGGFDAVVVGASIRYGHYAPEVKSWTDRNAAVLNGMPSAFFSVSILANKPHKNTPETHSYTRKFFEKTAWRPQAVGIFAGELAYHKYRFHEKHLMRLVMALNKGETDPSAHIEFTDWGKVAEFGRAVAGLLSSAADTPAAGR